VNEKAKARILIVDDVPTNLKILCDALESEGYRILVADNGEDALRIAADALPDIVLLDVVMPGMDGYQVCRRLKANEKTQDIPVIFITVRDDNSSLVESFRSGGVDYITKPFERAEVIVRVENHIKISRLTLDLFHKNQELEEEISRRKMAEEARDRAFDALETADEQFSLISRQEASRWGIDAFIGKSATIKNILRDIRQLQSTSKTSILIIGESGTGKELIARSIHFGGERVKGPFIPVNCSAIPGELAESAFFGHVKGAFSGADANRKGYFELANGGTLFLDEISDMPLHLQPKLLRVIEDGCFMPVGGTQERHVDVRIISATNQNPEEMMAKGTFREDLYHRLAGFTVNVPALRYRKDDISLLAEHFIGMFARDMRVDKPSLSPKASKAMRGYPFPGNVRELKNILEHAMIENTGPVIGLEHLRFVNSVPVRPVNSEGDSPVATKYHIIHHQRELEDSDIHATPELISEASKVMDYVQEHGSITNAQCRELLSIDRHRASYLLQKMNDCGILSRRGEHRWTHYILP
jgi:DNA-binding NtrC family response regulator